MTNYDAWKRVLRNDQGVDYTSTRRMVIGVLGAALLIDLVLVLANVIVGVMLGFGALVLIALVYAIRGNLLPGRLLIPAAGLAMLGYLMLFNKGLRDVAALGLPVILLVASLMMGRWGAVLYGALSLVLIAILWAAEASGLIRNVFSPFNTSVDYAIGGLIIVLITSLQWLIISRLNESVRRARDNEQAQAQANQQLRELQTALEERMTELKQAESARRISEQKYRSFIAESLEGFVLTDEQGAIVDWNAAQERITGLRREEVIGQFLWEVQWRLHPPERQSHARADMIRTMIQQSLQTGQAAFFGQVAEVEISLPDRQRAYIEQAAFPIKTEQGYCIASTVRDVTARKHSEEALRDSEALYQSLVEILPMSVCRKDLAGRFTFVNQRYCREFKLTSAEIIGKTDYDLHPAELAEQYRESDRVVIAGGQTVEMIEEHEPLGGERSYVQVFKSPIHDAKGQPNGIQIVYWDVTERKRTEYIVELRLKLMDFAATHSLEDLLQKTLDEVGELTNSPIGFYHFVEADQQTLSLQAWSTRTLNEFCHAEGKGLHYPIEQAGVWTDCVRERRPVIHNDYAALPHRRGLPEGHSPLIRELIVPISRDGRIVAILGVGNKAQAYTEREVEIVSYVADLAWEIAERKRAEQQIRQQAARAEALAELSQLLSQVSQDYQLVLDTVVRRCAELIGDGASVFMYDPDQPQLELAAAYNSDPDAIQIFREHMLTNPIRVDEGAYGHVLKTSQPVLVPVVPLEKMLAEATPERRTYYQRLPLYSAMFAPLRAQGKILGVLGLGRHVPSRNYVPEDLTFLQDIADRSALALLNSRLYGELQQELLERKQLIKELEAKNAELERFTYTVSHDLKSPLVTIRGFLGFLERDAISGDMTRLKTDMTRIVVATDKMQRLLTELLELSRIGRMMNPPQAVPFETIVREALELVHGRLAARGVQVEVAGDLPVVYGDRVRLVEVMQNLIDNACKFMGDQADPRISIGVRGSDRDGKPIVFVRDNGIGIDPQYHAKVFGLFDKLDPKSDGTGIGLALVKRIIEVHGGKIWLESESGHGATFCFTLPRPDVVLPVA